MPTNITWSNKWCYDYVDALEKELEGWLPKLESDFGEVEMQLIVEPQLRVQVDLISKESGEHIHSYKRRGYINEKNAKGYRKPKRFAKDMLKTGVYWLTNCNNCLNGAEKRPLPHQRLYYWRHKLNGTPNSYWYNHYETNPHIHALPTIVEKLLWPTDCKNLVTVLNQVHQQQVS